jgi:hypothetical protein
MEDDRGIEIKDIWELSASKIRQIIIEDEELILTFRKILQHVYNGPILRRLVERLNTEANPRLRELLIPNLLDGLMSAKEYYTDEHDSLNVVFLQLKYRPPPGDFRNIFLLRTTREGREILRPINDEYERIIRKIEREYIEFDMPTIERMVEEIINILNDAADRNLISFATMKGIVGIIPAIILTTIHVIGQSKYESYERIILKIQESRIRRVGFLIFAERRETLQEIISINRQINHARNQQDKDRLLQRRQQIVDRARQRRIDIDDEEINIGIHVEEVIPQEAIQEPEPEALRYLRELSSQREQTRERPMESELVRKIRQQREQNERRLAQVLKQNTDEAAELERTARNDRLNPVNINLLVDRIVPPMAKATQAQLLPKLSPDTYKGRREALDFAAEMHEKLKCPVCTIHKVDRVLIPCGHFICSFCLPQLTIKKCPMCQTPYSSAISVTLMKYLKYKNKYLQLKNKVF